MSRKKVLLSLVVAGLILGCVAWAAESKKPELPELKIPDFSGVKASPVVRVIDGNTFIVSIDGKETKIRLEGVDTPETVHPSRPVQKYGKDASLFTTNLLKGEKVYLRYDGDKPKIGKYGRVIVYAYRAPDGLFINAEIIRQGYGHAYVKYPFKLMEEFRQLERFAREAKKGLWGSQIPKPKPKEKPTARTIQNKEQDITVFITRTGKKYHRGTCRYIRRSRISIELKDAKARGYTSCSGCSPPR